MPISAGIQTGSLLIRRYTCKNLVVREKFNNQSSHYSEQPLTLKNENKKTVFSLVYYARKKW